MVPTEARISREKSSAQRFHASASALCASFAAKWAWAVGSLARLVAGRQKAAATRAARRVRFICFPWVMTSIDQADGQRLAIGRVQHFRAHQLASPIGRYGQ